MDLPSASTLKGEEFLVILRAWLDFFGERLIFLFLHDPVNSLKFSFISLDKVLHPTVLLLSVSVNFFSVAS